MNRRTGARNAGGRPAARIRTGCHAVTGVDAVLTSALSDRPSGRDPCRCRWNGATAGGGVLYPARFAVPDAVPTTPTGVVAAGGGGGRVGGSLCGGRGGGGIGMDGGRGIG